MMSEKSDLSMIISEKNIPSMDDDEIAMTKKSDLVIAMYEEFKCEVDNEKTDEWEDFWETGQF